MIRIASRLCAPLAIALSVAVGLSGCVALPAVPQGPSTSTPLPVDFTKAPFDKIDPRDKYGYLSLYNQRIVWTPCESGMQCAMVVVPETWDDPGGRAIGLHLIRHRATGNNPLGSLLVNPGGPGASGIDFVRDSLDYAVSPELQQAYDVIGFDPRGVGKTSPVQCTTFPKDLDEFLYGYIDKPRGSAEWIAERVKYGKEFGSGCSTYTFGMLKNVDTINAARDMDLIRSLVGDPALNYLGYSYGTLLGATYADLYPTLVGRMVLDGALDPASSGPEVMRMQAIGFESALRSYLTWCLTEAQTCPFGKASSGASVDGALARISSLLAQLEASPLTAEDGRKLGADVMVTGIISPLYTKVAWPNLSAVFTDVIAGGTQAVFESADRYNDRNADGTYNSNSTEAFSAINCLDYPTSKDPADWAAAAAELAAVAPTIGPYLSYGETLCASWPYKPKRQPAPISAPGSPDILVVGTTNDPATPYQWAVNLAGQLSKGHLITYHGEGHTAYNKSNACVNNAVDGFFLTGAVPERDPDC
jgi:pimeloyl-ACP methyl ester carboxylesterase